MTVYVHGRPITEYRHKGDTFVMGRNGSEYELDFRNNHPSRRMIISASIDGLSILTGEPAKTHAQGYVLEPMSSTRIKGWRTSQEACAQFEFGSIPKAYATQQGAPECTSCSRGPSSMVSKI